MFSFLRPFLFKLDPEVAHDLAIQALKFKHIPKNYFEVNNENILASKVFNINFNNPIGLAAGFDKSAEVYNSIFKFGFGFVEVGTVTPRKQFGNPKPRVFRLEKDKALINRLGFNNDGMEIIRKRILKNKPENILGINIGPNKDTDDKIKDYKECLSSLVNLGSYITINISSPNTEGLRNLHNKDSLTVLLSEIRSVVKSKNIKKPLLIKISPDLVEKNISEIIELISKFNINGLIISNTTDQNRSDLLDLKKNEKGGLSGKPLRAISNKLIKTFYREVKGKIPIIGVGGVNSGQDVFDKMTSGASLIQLYTGLVYEGPLVVKKIKSELIEILYKQKIKKISDIVGSNT